MLKITPDNEATFEHSLRALEHALLHRYGNRAHARLRLTFDAASCMFELSCVDADLDPLTKRMRITSCVLAAVNPCTSSEGFVVQVPAAPDGDEVLICNTLAEAMAVVDAAVKAWHVTRHFFAKHTQAAVLET